MTAWFDTQHCYFIAEIGVNHDGDVDVAKEMIDVAADAGADAVKFQTFVAKRLVTPDAEKAAYQDTNDPRAGETQFQMLKRLELSREELIACRDHCKVRGIEFLSTPFDEESADLLEEVGVRGFKVSSGDLTNLPLLAHLAAKGLPIILSTGMGSLEEVQDAVGTIQTAGSKEIAILHCVSNYPADPAECNLRAMDTMRDTFGVSIGWSDHTLGSEITLAAVARGARLIEKHFTLDTSRLGPDHKASLMPDELVALIKGIRAVESALGDGVKQAQPSEIDTARVARRSIIAAQDIPAGTEITRGMLEMKRPGTGLKPKHLGQIVGHKAARNIAANTIISLEDVT